MNGNDIAKTGGLVVSGGTIGAVVYTLLTLLASQIGLLPSHKADNKDVLTRLESIDKTVNKLTGKVDSFQEEIYKIKTDVLLNKQEQDVLKERLQKLYNK